MTCYNTILIHIRNPVNIITGFIIIIYESFLLLLQSFHFGKYLIYNLL